MATYLKLFETHTQYETFIGGGGNTPFVKPNVSYCVQENEVHYNPLPHDYSKDYLTFLALEDGTFTFTPANNNAISYSIDNGHTWTDLAADTNTPTVTRGNKVLWRGKMTPTSSNGVGTFSSTGQFNVQGNIMSLLFGDKFKGETDLTGKNYAFYKLFNSNSNLVNAQNLSLSATTLAKNCYEFMFEACTSLVNAPELPATKLADYCYFYMFNGCTGLTTAPELPATTLAQYCYSSMFSGCTNLVNAPELPATTLASGCYRYMFEACTNLVNAPELPATTLAYQCYYSMFEGCTSLVNAPKLPVTTLAGSCYIGMFSGCTSLTTAPELPATTLAQYCYSSMFYGCTKLNYIKAMFTTTPGEDYTYDWVNGVASKGTFVKNSAATWDVTGVDGIPDGWEVQPIVVPAI